ncbi:MAG: glutathione S-transferase [Comamonadaceae bacterium]|nr:MAG: glutathione S-transferase [Comamonadaceae bacterium]
MLHLWGRLSSINVRKVVLAAQELGLEFQRTEAGGHFGVVKTAEFMALNPNSLVPLMEDDGFTLWESNVIVRYLCGKHSAGALYPASFNGRFDAERWMDWQQTTLNPAGRDAFVQLVRKPGGQSDAARIEQSVAATEPLLDLLDAHLQSRAFVLGDTFTMADIPIACEVHRWFSLPRERRQRTHLDRWWQQVQARPSARGVLDITLS